MGQCIGECLVFRRALREQKVRQYVKSKANIRRIAFVGDYPPRKCGIATFTFDLCHAVAAQDSAPRCLVVSVNDLPQGYAYPPEVRFEIAEQDLACYHRAADFLNVSNVDVVCVQHEFGIFGGRAGSHLLALLRDLRVPIVTTLHSILREPNAEQRRVTEELLRLSTRVVSMSQHGVEFLKNVYHVPAAKLDLIPHGIPDMPFVDPNYYKDDLGMAGRTVLLTFGLLSPSKGIEYVLRAIPDIAREFPTVVYIVVGQIHPKLLREQGEMYRLELERLTKNLGIQKHVVFFDQFVALEELKTFIGAANIYLTPYLNEERITSGTLAYAFGAGKAVVSTRYWHAMELLAEDRGILVPFRDATAIAQAVCELLRDDPRCHAMRKNAYRLSRDMVWPQVGALYMKTFGQARVDLAFLERRPSLIKTLDEAPEQLPAVKLDHLIRMTDGTGLFQHAIFTVPSLAEGYCTDDNARALVLLRLLQPLGYNGPCEARMFSTYLAFLHHAFDPRTRRFRNFLNFDRHWREEIGSEDCHARAVWALGLCVDKEQLDGVGMLAARLFESALPVMAEFTSPRAWALALLGIHHYLHRMPGDRLVTQLREEMVERLLRLYRATADDDWPWFEDVLSYDNAKLPHALILSGRVMRDPAALETGLKTLRWLVRLQTTDGDFFSPIGSNGFYRRGGQRALFDQQPIEAQAMVSACLEAYVATQDAEWLAHARRAFEWFLGRNVLGLALYDSTTGGTCDGLHVGRVNQNQGAESMLAFLLARAEMQAVQETLSAFRAVAPVEQPAPTVPASR